MYIKYFPLYTASIEEESKFDDGTEKPLRVYKKMKGEKVIPHQLLNPTSNENGEYHSQAENNVIAVSNDIEKDEEMVHRNTEREGISINIKLGKLLCFPSLFRNITSLLSRYSWIK